MRKSKKFLPPSMAAVLLLAAGAASAQTSVTIYGRVDAGIDYTTNSSDNGKTSGGRWSAASNQWGTSMIGFKGNEDLGGGLKAIFDLESGFGAPTGTTNNSALFNRFAYVGLTSSTAGTVKFGNILAIDNDVWYIDPMGQQWMSSASLVKGRSWLNAPNSVQYESPNLGGFTANVQYSFGQVAGSTSSNSKGGVSLAYVQPTFEIRAIYDVTHDAGGDYSDIYNTSKEFILGGTATFGPAKLFAAYQTLSAPNAPVDQTDKAKHYWLGVNYQATAPLLLRAAVFHVAPNNGASSANLYVIGADYSLSKRTLLWATAGTFDNGANGTFSQQYWLPQVPGQNTSSFNAGVSHSF